MSAFTLLEQAALAAIRAEMAEPSATVEQQLLHATVHSRENTGGGFFTVLEIAPGVESADRQIASFGQNIWIRVDGLEYGLGMILHLKNGWANLLEGYAVGSEDTSFIDFASVPFAIASEPGPLRTSDSSPPAAVIPVKAGTHLLTMVAGLASGGFSHLRG